MAASPELLTDDDRVRIDAAIVRLRDAQIGTDHRALRAAVEGLDAASKDFAARRMNRALEEGLRGRQVSEVETQVDKSGSGDDLQTRLSRSGHSGHSHS
jgi:molecular chaperone HscA